jgi:hypothetical protein
MGSEIVDLIVPMGMICGFFLLYFILFLGYNRSMKKSQEKAVNQ